MGCRVTEVSVGYALGGRVQLVRYEYSEEYSVERCFTYSGDWSEDEAKGVFDEKYAECKAEVEALAQAEVDRLMALRDELNG